MEAEAAPLLPQSGSAEDYWQPPDAGPTKEGFLP